ncbi:MAG: BMP family lipoprotein [Jatrophihabitans sp.]
MQRWRGTAVVAGLACLTLAMTGCGSKKDNSGNTGGGTSSGSSSASGGGASSFKGCMVTDTGGIDDKSFNASAWAGMQQAQSEGKATVSYVESKTETDYTTNINKLLAQKCNLIVTVGGLMGEATKAAATANPNQHFAEVDNPGNGTNWQGLQFNAAQGGFMGGYLAAGYSKSGIVATYGGISIPPVTIYMDGFWEGVQYYNQQKGKSVKVLGWDEKSQKGTFGGGFTDQNKGQTLTQNFINQGADVIFPVAGGLGLGSAAIAKSTGKAVVIWVDTDGYDSAPQYQSVFLSTVFKDVKGAVHTAVTADSGGTFSAKDYIGDLSNGGTGLSPFHDFDSKVDSSLKTELDKIKQDIISGTIKITSPSQPK